MAAPPPDVFSAVIFWIISIGMYVALYAIPKLVKKRKQREQYLDHVDFSKHAYNDMTESDLHRIISSLNVSYPVLLVIYGVLLAFVVSDKITLAFTSSYFVIWCGFILAIIVRTGMIVISLFDLGDVKSKKQIGRTIEDAKKFFKVAIFLLIPTVAFIPTVFIEPTHDFKTTISQWSHELSIATVAISIFIAFSVFYVVPFRPLSFARKTGLFDLSFFIIFLIIFGAFVGTGSPLDPYQVSLNNQIYTIPSGLYTALAIGVGFFFLMIIWYMSILREKNE